MAYRAPPSTLEDIETWIFHVVCQKRKKVNKRDKMDSPDDILICLYYNVLSVEDIVLIFFHFLAELCLYFISISV